MLRDDILGVLDCSWLLFLGCLMVLAGVLGMYLNVTGCYIGYELECDWLLVLDYGNVAG